MPASAKGNRGKSMFVKEILLDNEFANTQAVNEAWRAAGMSGDISAALVNKIRSTMGLAGNLRGKRASNGRAAAGEPIPSRLSATKRGRPRKDASAATNSTNRAKGGSMQSTLIALELDIDRLLFKVNRQGKLLAVEDSLREVRRLLYARLKSTT
jgi:hypothetical protein